MNIKALFTSTLAELTSQMKLTPQEEDKLWYEFLDFLHKENSHFGRYFIRQVNLQGEFIEQIKDQIDVDIDDIEDIIEDDDYWNKSIKSLCKKFLEYKQKIENQEDIKFGGNNLEITEIKNSDSGADFSNEGEWVKPAINIDGKLYSEIRGLDKVISALTNYMCIQFTNTQLQEDNSLNERKSWIRLIIPQYSRRVEVEDLNRNFWVIAQTTSAVCSWLFDEDNSVLSLLNGILSEISQLWENVLYLWAALALKNQKQNYYVHTEMINIDSIPYLLPGGIQYNEIQEKIEYLKDKYNQNLCIIPYTKHIYKHNYYDNIIIPAIYLYHQGTKEWNTIKFNTPIQIDISDKLQDKIYALREDNYEMNYEYGAPYSEIKNLYGPNEAYFYGALRVYPDFKFILAPTSLKLQEEDGYCKGGFKVYDAARAATEGEVHRVLTIKIKSDGTYYFNYVNGNRIDNIDFKYREPQYCNNSLYLGEVISKREKSAAAEIKDAEFKVVKIGDFYPLAILGSNFDDVNNTPFDIFKDKFNQIVTRQTTSGYDLETYGIGSYYTSRNTPFGRGKYQLVYVNYNSFYVDKNRISYAKDITSSLLTDYAKEYIKHLREESDMLNDDVQSGKSMIYATKIGVAYWTGDSGSQWNYGLVTDLIYVHQVKGKWVYDSLAKPYLFDGYWTNDSETFKTNPPTNNARWRRLYLGCDSMRISKINGEYKIKNIQNGLIVWYDHNFEPPIRNPKTDNRPRGTMTIDQNEENNQIIFQNLQNYCYDINDNRRQQISKMAVTIQLKPDEQNPGQSDIFETKSGDQGTYAIGKIQTVEDIEKIKKVFKGGAKEDTVGYDSNWGMLMSGAKDVSYFYL